MSQHIHVHLHRTVDAKTNRIGSARGGRPRKTVIDVEGIKTQKSSGGVTTWGGADPKKVVPKPIVGSKDAGTSEGAKKAAQTRKSHGGGGSSSQFMTRSDPDSSTPATHVYHQGARIGTVEPHTNGGYSSLYTGKTGTSTKSESRLGAHASEHAAVEYLKSRHLK